MRGRHMLIHLRVSFRQSERCYGRSCMALVTKMAQGVMHKQWGHLEGSGYGSADSAEGGL